MGIVEVKPIRRIRQYFRCYKLGDIAPQHLYKYMNIQYAKESIIGDYMFFQKLSQWTDQYEKRFYTADYSQLNIDKGLTPKVYACCLTGTELNEAHINAYRNGEEKICIRFKLNTRNLRKFFDSYAIKHDSHIYEGRVFYDLSNKLLQGLHKSRHKYHAIFFQHFVKANYFSLLLLKRQAFRHEDEIRFFVEDQCISGDSIKIPVDWSKVVESIIVTADKRSNYYKDFVKLCAMKGIASNLIQPYDLYSMEEKQITIEP